MIVRNKKSGEKYEVSSEEFQHSIIAKGNGHMYEIVDDDAPFEVKEMKARKLTELVNKLPDQEPIRERRKRKSEEQTENT